MTNKYEYLSHVLTNYFSVSVGDSEAAAVSALREDMGENQVLAAGVRRDFAAALADPDFSWQSILETVDVATALDEAGAREYASSLFKRISSR